MATWAELTAEQQDVYLNWEKDLRTETARAYKLVNALIRLKATKTAQIDAILVELDANEIIPNSSGLAGSSALDVDADAVTLFNELYLHFFTNCLSGTSTKNRAIKAAGSPNIRGE